MLWSNKVTIFLNVDIIIEHMCCLIGVLYKIRTPVKTALQNTSDSIAYYFAEKKIIQNLSNNFLSANFEQRSTTK